MKPITLRRLTATLTVVLAMLTFVAAGFAQDKKPNILVIWGDDIGHWNLSHINNGMMGYKTPNIDRIAREGMWFTDYYGEQSCTAGRASFITGQGIYPDGMVEHDGHVGQLLDYLDELGIAEDTIVIYSTDNGAEVFTWPDGGTTPFHGEKATCWEGGFRVPCAVRCPGKIPAGKVSNSVTHHMDWLPTLLAAAGEPDIKEKLLKGHQAGDKNFKVHLDGYNMLDHWKAGGEGEGPRQEVFYFTDVGELAAIRHGDYKIHFMIQEAHGFDVWKNPYTPQGWPSLVNLRADPFERAMHESIGWGMWSTKRMYGISAAAVIATDFLKTFLDYPPRQTPGSFSVDAIIKNLEAARSAGQ